jgi:hypothetical protein
VGPRAGLEDVEKRIFLTLPRIELRPLGRPARSQSLYLLRYPGSLYNCKRNFNCIVMVFIVRGMCPLLLCSFVCCALFEYGELFCVFVIKKSFLWKPLNVEEGSSAKYKFPQNSHVIVESFH